ncbi:hypothetical protein [Methylobacterium haplocladii]|uniref:Uncharacterized protein n=1 Tax=Methylobacterium haplocladii TaxID=1176176 RepID=A0A512IS82_9HYPH|nr:hypothetical protein [Methylobacterium haplocladii]GEP00567.1 hypothetical protein MHA02_29540 [Methylobacterium haplocladii]GJD85482.1 hypothetical protein HPGCJGGD_3371 [Methylobacterium haplocladii]GLS57715.1 hypothetical protein GCM10007887_03710 [Methylobacterium haplocladii]
MSQSAPNPKPLAPPDRLTAFFATLDRQLAFLARPDHQIDELNLRIAHNERCKSYLCRVGSQNYDAFDLTAIDAGLHGRLADAMARRDAPAMQEAA